MNMIFNTYKMKNLKLIVSSFGIASLLSLSACSVSFLDEANPQAVAFDQIKDLNSLTTASVGVYSKFTESNYYGRTFTLTPDIMGDNAFISIKNGGRYINQDRFSITNGDGYVTGAWSLMYQVIANANLALSAGHNLQFATQDEQVQANQILGELYACRALAYFDLLRFFAQPYNFTEDASHDGVPLITESQSSIISPPRASVAEVYAQIVNDLKQAEQLMRPAKKNGFFTQVAAQALLSKVYLYMEDWENAEIYASKVINDGPYTLVSNVDYVASWAEDFNIESIFEVVFLSTDNLASNGLGYLYHQGAYGEVIATKDLYDTYTSSDVRRELITEGSRLDGEQDAHFIWKYPRGASSYDDNIKVLRLAEIYLIRAEARAEAATPDFAGACDDLNEIVLRADPTATPVNLTGQDLVDRIILERRKELAFEGNRLFDINRKKMDLTHIQSMETREFTYPNNRFIMPIPYSERNANDNISQNPGWN